MSVQYLHLNPEEPPPPLAHTSFCAVIVTEVEASEDWRERITDWLVESGCLYAVAWGRDCEKWHDSVDGANLREFDYGDIPEDRFVMTTWHEDEPLKEAFWFAGQCAFHPTVMLTSTIIVDVSPQQREAAMLQAFRESQDLPDDDD
jgi:hypothetical protein